MAELWGENSATDNPPRPMILIPAHNSLLPRFFANSLPYVILLELGQGA